jgi:hypothetical protein
MVAKKSSFDFILCDFNCIELLLGHLETSLNIHIDVHLFGYAKLLFQKAINVVMKKAELDAKATWVGEGLEEFFGGTYCWAKSCTTKGLVR